MIAEAVGPEAPVNWVEAAFNNVAARAAEEMKIATLVSTPVSKAIGKFFITLNEPLIPHQLFTSEAEARESLKQFLD